MRILARLYASPQSRTRDIYLRAQQMTTAAAAARAIAANDRKIAATMANARRRLLASADDAAIRRGLSTVCDLVDALKIAKAAAKKPRKAAAAKKPSAARKTTKVKKRDPCEDVGTPARLMRCLDRCCARGNKK